MTTTSVKDVSTVMNAMAASVGNAAGATAGATAEMSFQSVWNNQSNKNPASEETQTQVSGNKNTDPRDEVLKAKETVRKPVKETAERTEKETGLSKEQTEEAMEVLGTAAGEMMQQVADAFGMSLEELKQLMEELDMNPLDILNPEQLSTLLLQAAGVEDSMALLTNEELYADFRQLMNRQQELLAMAGEKLEVPQEQLAQFISELDKVQEGEVIVPVQEALTNEVAEPGVEVSVEADETDDTVQAKNSGESVGLVENQTQGSDEALVVHETQSKAQTGGDEEQGATNSNEQTGNLFLQNLKNEIMQPEVNAVQTANAWDADTQEIMRQIMDYLRIQIKPDMSDVEMQLHPESLGTLQIHVSSKGGVLTANFVTQNETVKAVLESQMIQLKENFAEQGMKVENIEVTVQTHQFERNLDQGRGSNQSEPEKKGRNRRINLNALNGLEEPEEMTKEDELVAEMMTANGNTVDYTA